MSRRSQLSLLACFFENGQYRSEVVTMKVLEQFRAVHFLEAVTTTFTPAALSNVVAFCTDGCSTMAGDTGGFATLFKQHLQTMGTDAFHVPCVCHVLHLVRAAAIVLLGSACASRQPVVLILAAGACCTGWKARRSVPTGTGIGAGTAGVEVVWEVRAAPHCLCPGTEATRRIPH